MAAFPFSLSFDNQSAPLHNAPAAPVVPEITPPNPYATSPDGTKTFYGRTFDNLTIVNNTTGKTIVLPIIVKDIQYDISYQGVVFSPDSKYLYVLEIEHGPEVSFRMIRKIDAGTGRFVEGFKVPLSYRGEVLDITPDGSSVIVMYRTLGSGLDYKVIDTASGRVQSLNTSSTGAAGDGRISDVRLFEDGTSVLFVSTSGNLVAGDTNGAADIFRKDLATGRVTLLSASADGVAGNGASQRYSVSADGTKIVFESLASNLAAGDRNGTQDVFVKDLSTGKVTLVSASTGGRAADGASGSASFSPDGNQVVFRSTAGNLAPGDTAGTDDVFLKDLRTGTLTALSYLSSAEGTKRVPVTAAPVFTEDGQSVRFGRYAYDLEGAGRLLIDLRGVPNTGFANRALVSKGDGSTGTLYDVEFLYMSPHGRQLTAELTYGADGDYRATIEALRYDMSLGRLTLDIKVRAHSGAQTFTGTAASEIVLLSAAADRADGGGGDDALLGGDGADTLLGGAGNDHLNGGRGADFIDGGIGQDRMVGGLGRDTYRVDNSGDQVIEAVGEGSDTVLTSISYRLATGQKIETLRAVDAAGTNKLTLVGNEFANALFGNAGANTLDGGVGADVLTGLAGSDTYRVDNGGDRVIEAAGGGQDTVLTAISHALAAGQEIEILATQNAAGTAALNLFGNTFANTIRGNAGKNLINGREGADVLTGGAGADTFVFDTKLGSGNVERITDFAPVDDTIRLSKAIFTELAAGQLKANEFKDIAKAGRDGDDHILYDSRNGKLFYDADGSGKGVAVQFAVLDNKAAITHADFLIV